MVTVGLVRELHFLTHVTQSPIDFFIGHPDKGDSILLRVGDGILEVYYHGKRIWREAIEGDVSFFGIESCDTISRIISCLNNNDSEGAESLFYTDNPLDRKSSLS